MAVGRQALDPVGQFEFDAVRGGRIETVVPDQVVGADVERLEGERGIVKNVHGRAGSDFFRGRVGVDRVAAGIAFARDDYQQPRGWRSGPGDHQCGEGQTGEREFTKHGMTARGCGAWLRGLNFHGTGPSAMVFRSVRVCR